MLKYLINYALEHCKDDLAFLEKREQDEQKNKPQNERQEMSLTDRLRFVADNDFERVSYTEAVEILRNSKPNKKKKFQFEQSSQESSATTDFLSSQRLTPTRKRHLADSLLSAPSLRATSTLLRTQ